MDIHTVKPIFRTFILQNWGSNLVKHNSPCPPASQPQLTTALLSNSVTALGTPRK